MFEEPSDPTPCAYGRCLPLTAFLGGVGFSPTFNTASVKSQTRKKYLGICLALRTAAREFRISRWLSATRGGEEESSHAPTIPSTLFLLASSPTFHVLCHFSLSLSLCRYYTSLPEKKNIIALISLGYFFFLLSFLLSLHCFETRALLKFGRYNVKSNRV